MYCLSKIVHTQKRLLIVIFSLAFIVRLLFVAALENQLVWYDEIQYDAIARSMLRGEGYGSTAFAPLQPFFLLGVYSIFGADILAARLAQVLLGALTSIVVCLVGTMVFDRNVGVLAGFISVFYPYFVYVTGALYPTALFMLLLALAIFSLLRFYDNGQKSCLILAGVALGLSLLAIPTVLFFLPMIPLWFLLSRKFTLKQVAAYSTILMVVTLMVVAPWSIRNSLHYGQFVLVTTEGGHAFWQGNNPYFDGVNRPGPDDIPQELRQKLKGLSKIEKDRVYYRESFNFIRNKPMQFVKLYIIKFFNYWRLYPNTISENRFTTLKTKIISLLTYGLLLPFALFGIIKSVFHNKKTLLLLFLMLSFSLGYSLFLTSVRYRIPLDVYVIVFAAFGIICVFKSVFPVWKKNLVTTSDY